MFDSRWPRRLPSSSVGLAGSPAPAEAAVGDSWIIGDSYHRVLLQGDVYGFETERWQAICPSAYPYLDRRAGTDGRGLGKGIIASETDWGVVIVEGSGILGVADPNKRTWRTQPNGDHIYTGNAGVATNTRLATPRGAYVEMVCTSNAYWAWTLPAPR